MQNKKAWEFNAYEFWIRESGRPADRARKALEDPIGMLRKYAAYFDAYTGIRVANICGSCGKKAIPLAILGAEVTIFDMPTADLRILPKGTGYITDLGMTGPKDSALGIRPEQSIALFRGELTSRFEPAPGPNWLCGAVFTIDLNTNRCTKVEQVQIID